MRRGGQGSLPQQERRPYSGKQPAARTPIEPHRTPSNPLRTSARPTAGAPPPERWHLTTFFSRRPPSSGRRQVAERAVPCLATEGGRVPWNLRKRKLVIFSTKVEALEELADGWLHLNPVRLDLRT